MTSCYLSRNHLVAKNPTLVEKYQTNDSRMVLSEILFPVRLDMVGKSNALYGRQERAHTGKLTVNEDLFDLLGLQSSNKRYT